MSLAGAGRRAPSVDVRAAPRPQASRGGGSRTTFRWRLTIVYGAVAISFGLLLLLLALVFVDRALSVDFANSRDVVVRLPGGRLLTFEQFQDQLRTEAMSQVLRRGLLALLGLGALGVGVAYLIAGRVLQPLQRITSAAQRLSVERLDARIELAGPEDELKRLADTFDAMLGRLEASFEHQRRFVADASHELRTPLAVMRTEAEVALADEHASAAELRAATEVVRDASIRAGELVDSLLLLARSDRLQIDGLPLRAPVSLPAVAANAATAVAAEAQARRIDVASELAPAVVLGDPGLLERLAGNLVENAVAHNVDDGWVRIDTGQVGGRALLQVSNSGPLVEPGQVPQLFEPFRRYGTARTARRGAGLGLAIVRSVAQVHGGTAVAEARAGGGLIVTVDLPTSEAGPDAADDAGPGHPG